MQSISPSVIKFKWISDDTDIERKCRPFSKIYLIDELKIVKTLRLYWFTSSPCVSNETTLANISH